MVLSSLLKKLSFHIQTWGSRFARSVPSVLAALGLHPGRTPQPHPALRPLPP